MEQAMTLPEGVERADPEIQLTFERCVCSLHGEPFRETWPEGYPKFMMALVGELMTNESFHEATRGDVKNWNSVLDRKPACHWIGPAGMLAAYMTSGVGVEGSCDICLDWGMGTPFHTLQVTYKHMCFECVVGNGDFYHGSRQNRRDERRTKRERRRKRKNERKRR
jgi:hypothetical protein